MLGSKKRTEGRVKTIEQDTKRKLDNELNKMMALGWEPIWDSFRVTTPLGGLTGKSIYTVILKKS